jgi:hypothetical protein
MIYKDTGKAYAEAADQICNVAVESMRTLSAGVGLSFCKNPYDRLISGVGCLRRFERGKTIALEVYGGRVENKSSLEIHCFENQTE